MNLDVYLSIPISFLLLTAALRLINQMVYRQVIVVKKGLIILKKPFLHHVRNITIDISQITEIEKLEKPQFSRFGKAINYLFNPKGESQAV